MTFSTDADAVAEIGVPAGAETATSPTPLSGRGTNKNKTKKANVSALTDLFESQEEGGALTSEPRRGKEKDGEDGCEIVNHSCSGMVEMEMDVLSISKKLNPLNCVIKAEKLFAVLPRE